MRTRTFGLILAAVSLLWASSAPAANPARECLMGVLDGSGVPYSVAPTPVSCADGDPTCDSDGAINGSCTFKVQACVDNVDPACTPQTLKKATATVPKLLFPKKLGVFPKISIPVTPDGTNTACSAVTDVVVPLKTVGGKKHPHQVQVMRKVHAVAVVSGLVRDVDNVKLICTPPTVPCAANPDGGPSQLTLKVGPGGGDLDTGFSGRSHNFINVPNSSLTYCLSGCDGVSTTTCQGSGPTGDGTVNGIAFGPPLPLFSSNVAVCVVNRFKDPTVQATVDLVSGKVDARATPLNLLSDTYQGNPNQVCPRCIQGKCDSGRSAGQACKVGGTVTVNNPPNIVNVSYPVSADCLPSTTALLGTPEVSLGLTNETSTLSGNPLGAIPCPGQAKHDECGSATCTVECSATPDFKGGINQTCCSNAQHTPCFPTDTSRGGTGTIVREGSITPPQPPLPDPTYPKIDQGVLAATFCIPPTGSITVDSTAGLAGPGAVLLPGSGTFLK